MKTLGVDVFHSYYPLFQKIKNSQKKKKIKNSSIVRKSTSRNANILQKNLCTITKRLNENCRGEMHLTLTIYHTIISKIQKFAKNLKTVRSSRKT